MQLRHLLPLLWALLSLTSASGALAQDSEPGSYEDEMQAVDEIPTLDHDLQAHAQDPELDNGYTGYATNAEREAIRADVERHLNDREFRFCQDNGYRMSKVQKEMYCGHTEALKETCPGIKGVCRREAWDAHVEETKPEQKSSDKDLSVAPWLGELTNIIFWGALILGLGFLLFHLIKASSSWRMDAVSSSPQADLPDVPHENEEFLQEELEVQKLIEQAREQLAQGAPAAALLLVYRATVRGLAEARWIKANRSKTSGDYQRSMQITLNRGRLDNPTPGQLEVGTVEQVNEISAHLRSIDRERFRAEPRTEEAQKLLERTKQLVHVLSSAAAICLSFILVGCDDRFMVEPPGAPGSPEGTLLFEKLLEEESASYKKRMRRLREAPLDATLVVSLGARLKESEWEQLREWTADGGYLIVQGPDEHFRKVFSFELETVPCTDDYVSAHHHETKYIKPLRAFLGDAPGTTYATCGGMPVAFGQSWGNGWITYLATEAVFENIVLAAGDNAAFALYLAGAEGATTEYLGPWTGLGAESAVQGIVRGEFGWWVLHILLLAAIAAWALGKRFGTPLDPPEERRRAFTEHALALSRQYEKSRSSGFMLAKYAEWVAEHLRRRTATTANTKGDLATAIESALAEKDTLASNKDQAKRHLSIFRRLKSAVTGR